MAAPLALGALSLLTTVASPAPSEPLAAWPEEVEPSPGSESGAAGTEDRAEAKEGTDAADDEAGEAGATRREAAAASPAPHPDPDAPLPAGADERPLVDYDARRDRTTAGDVLLWVPRVLLSPLYLVSEFVVRRPLGWLATTAEKNEWPASILSVLTFGPEQTVGVVPTALLDFGLRPSVGLYFFWDDALVDANDLRAHVAWGGDNWYSATLTDRFQIGEEQDVSLRAAFKQRPDWVFHGFGPSAPSSALGRFQQRTLDGSASYYGMLPDSSLLEARAGVRHTALDGAVTCCGDPSVADQVARGTYAPPPRIDDDYLVAYQDVRLVLDSRPRRFATHLGEGSDFASPPGSGVRLALRGGHAIGLDERAGPGGGPSRDHWVRYGGALGGHVDAFGDQRALGLTVMADFVDPLGDAPVVPFVEQVQLGGSAALPGGLPGRLVGRSATAATLTYEWPVWVWLDGHAFYEVGNVFGADLEQFEAGLLRSSFGGGIRANGARDHVFQVLVAFLTEPARDGHAIDEVRFVFGASNEF